MLCGEEIDTERRLWIIPKERMKAYKEHTVPLSDKAWKILENISPNLSSSMKPSGLIFPSKKGTALSDMTFTQMLRRMNEPYTVHGFRASFRTWGADIAHYQHELLEHALAHVVYCSA